MEATPAQERAATTLDRHLAVTAGPGSGKTRVLVSRYLRILETRAARIENVVAITFTNKAAGEMRERLRAEIDRRAETARKTPDEFFWRDARRRLESAVITTIHGFCSRIIRENPVEAVVDPQFATLDDYSASVMLDASAQSAVTDLINGEDDLGARLVAAYGRPALVDHLVGVYTTLRGLGVALDEAERATLEGLTDGEEFRARVGRVDELLAEAEARLELERRGAPRDNARKKIEAFAAVWEELRAEIGAAPEVERSVAFASALKLLQLATPPKAIVASLKPWVDAVRAVFGEKADSAPPGTLELAFYDVCARPFVPILFKTLRATDALYALEKRGASALDYEDLQLKARELLSDHPEVARRVRGRYRFFLVDEFQDTNNLQREIIGLIAAGEPAPNLFIVGDRKQSIYGFRGAEVEVFSRTVRDLEREGGEALALSVNFRSDPRLVAFFNALFSRLMRPEPGEEPEEIEPLGYVAHEPGEARRSALDAGPAVEILLDLPRSGSTESESLDEALEGDGASEEAREERAREREARRLAARIAALVEGGEPVVLDRSVAGEAPAARAARYGDVAMLLRALSDVKTYERALRREGVPYYVVAGKGFYDRPETSDLLNLLEFLDNRSDEVALSAVLRSPLFGISDETLLALRADRLAAPAPGGAASPPRSLFEAARGHAGNGLVAAEQRAALDDAAHALDHLLALRNRASISALLREALDLTGYETVAAAAEDGAQRLSNLDKLVAIARQFERGATRLLRDFVEYVREFRRLEGREAEAYLRTGENAVAILTVHKAKGLEFPVVVVPDLQREFNAVRGEMLFDRSGGLAFKIPDGRGGLARTAHFASVAERKATRDRFEAMRLLYVAATRAQDYLILSGASNRKIGVDGMRLRDAPSWLHWVASALGEAASAETQEVAEVGGALVRVVGPRLPIVRPERPVPPAEHAETAGEPEGAATDPFLAVERVRRMLGAVPPDERASVRRFAATSLQSYANCERRFYYTRLLRLPGSDSAASMRDLSESAEAGARLPASLRGLVIHRFCETYMPGDDLRARLAESYRDVRTARGDAYADLLAALDADAVAGELAPLARNYVESRMRRRVEERLVAGRRLPDGQHEYVRSEMGFTLRVAEGLVFGTIDKVLITPLASGRVRAHVVDFKTTWLPREPAALAAAVEAQALEYRLQMQIYAQAVRRLVPGATVVEATLHFLHPGPDVEYDYPPDVVGEARAGKEVDRLITEIARGGYDPAAFPARPGSRCRTCAFRQICPEGAAEEAPAADGA